MRAESGQTVAEWRTFGSYHVGCRPVGPGDGPILHPLTLGARWPHRERDFDLFLSLGQGYLALDEIGRAVGSAMAFPVGDDLAMLGLMVTARRMQAQGVGRWLLDLLLRDHGGRDLRLSATREAYWLYEAAGFVPVAPVWQHQGKAGPLPPLAPLDGVGISPVTVADHDAVGALDARAYGGHRGALLARLLAKGQGVVARRRGEACGFALMWRFGRGRVIGPIIAEDEAMALHLAAPLIDAAAGQFLRVDTTSQDAGFRDHLAAAGLAPFASVTEMYRGRQRRAMTGPKVLALASHSLG